MKKKVLFVIKNLQGGGAEKVLVDIVNNLNYEKFDITIYLLRFEGTYLNSVNKEVKIKFDTKKISGFYCKKIQMRFAKYFPKLYYWFKIRDKYDIEVGFLEGIATKIIANSLNTKSRKIGWIHIDLLKKHWTKRFFLGDKEEEESYRKLDSIVFVSSEAKNAFSTLFPHNVTEKHVIYNPIITNDIKEKANKEEIIFDEFTVVSVGRLNNQKGFDRLIIAHSECIKNKPHRLVIIGEGEEKLKLQQLAKELNVDESVRIIGFLENPYPYIKAADLFICSSRSEGFSLVVAEALVLNKPIISTKVTGPIEILKNGEFGVIVDNSIEGILDGLNMMVKNEELLSYYSQKSIERLEFFNYTEIIKKIEELLIYSAH